MSEEPIDPEVDRTGIHVPRELADAEGVPIDLDANVGDAEWGVPSPARRRTAGWLYVGGAVLLAVGALGGLGGGLWIGVVGLAVLAGVNFLAAWPLAVDEQAALRTAVRDVGFAVGHASAAVRFAGWRSRPVWHVIVYDATEPPTQRALVRVDGVTGSLVGEPYVEGI